MHSIETLGVDPPLNWQDFEHLCWLLWHDEWNDPGTQKNGRQGQAQKGVDVFGQSQPGCWVGVQCKGKDNYSRKQVTERELRAEVEEAKRFKPALKEFILATTAPRNAKVQEWARTITAAHQNTGEFAVRVCSWDDIKDLLGRHPRVVSEFYAGASFAKDTATYTEHIRPFLEILAANQQQVIGNALDSQTSTLLAAIRLTGARSTGGHTATALPDMTESELEGAANRFTNRRRRPRASRQLQQPATTAVLPPDRLNTLGLVAVAPMPFTTANFKALFPEIDWKDQLGFFRRRGLVIANKGRISVPGRIRQSFLKSVEDRKPYLQQWIDQLQPLSEHPDISLYLALQQLHSGQFVESVCTIVDAAQISFPGKWNRIYLSILLNVNKPKALRRFTDDQRARYLDSVALCLSRERRFDEAIRWFARLRHFSKKTSNNWGIGQSYHNCGITFLEMGESSKAEACLRKAVRHTKRTRDDFLLGRALYELGMAVADRSQSEAADLFAESEKVKRRGKDRDSLAGIHHGYAVLAIKRGDYKDALRRFKQAEQAARHAGDYHGQALERFNTGRACMDLEEHETALLHLRQAIKMAESDELPDVLVLAVGAEAMTLARLGKKALAGKAFRKLYDLQRTAGNMNDAVIALHDVGAMMLDQGKYAEARNVLARAGHLAIQHGVVEWVYQCHTDIGTAYMMEGSNQKAVSTLRRFARHAERHKLYGVAARLWADVASAATKSGGTPKTSEEALEMALSSADKATDATPVKLQVYADIHIWRWQEGDFDGALAALRALLECAQASNDRRQIWAAHNQLGVCLQTLGRYAEAVAENRKALRIARQLNDPEMLEGSLNNLGEALRRSRRYAAAIELLEDAENLARSRGAPESAISIAHNRGLALEHQRKFDDARAIFQMCRDRSKRNAWWSEYVRALHALANLEWHRGNPAKAMLGYAKALKAAAEYRVSDYRTGISLNYANALRWQQQPGRALAILKSVEQQFRNEPDAHTYYSQLAALYDEVGDTINAAKYWESAYESAKRVNDQFAMALSAGAPAEEHDKAGRPEQADEYCRRALEHENDPELRATLFVLRLSLLLQMKKEPEAQEVFAEIEALSNNKKVRNEYVDALLMIGDYNWDEAIEDGIKGYVAAMVVASGVSNGGRFFEIGGMLATRLIDTTKEKNRPAIVDLERSCDQWLKDDQKTESENRGALLWPFRVAARVSDRLGMDSDLSKKEWTAIWQEEIDKAFR